MPGYRAGPSRTGLFGGYATPPQAPLVDVGGALDALSNGASSLIRQAYEQKRLEANQAYQRSRDTIADQRYADEQQQRQVDSERRFQLDRERADRENLEQGYKPAHTETQAVPAGSAPIAPLQPDMPSIQWRGVDTPIGQALGARIPIRVTPSNAPASTGPGDRVNANPAPAAAPSRVPYNRTQNVEAPSSYDPTKSGASIIKQGERTRLGDAIKGVGGNDAQAALGAERPDLIDNMLYPTGQTTLHAAADGTAFTWDPAAKKFTPALDATGKPIKLRVPSDPVATHQANRRFDIEHPTPKSSSTGGRDPNVSAAIATQRAITDNNRSQTDTRKSLGKLVPPALSANPRADSTAMVAGRTPLVEKLGDLTVRGDSLQRAYDAQASKIGTGERANANVDVTAARQELDRRRQQMEAIVANPNAPLSVKARAQDLFRQHVEALGIEPDSPGASPKPATTPRLLVKPKARP